MKALLVPLMLAVGLAGAPARADSWPQRPIKMLVPAAAGGSTDRGARVIARLMSVHLRQPIVVENKAGGGGRIAPYEAARATPDGYTILFGNSIGNALLPAVVKKINYDPLKDFKPIGIALSYATLLTCNKRKGLSSFDKFKTYAQANPSGIGMANAGPGSGNHFAAEQLGQQLNAQFMHVPYRGNAPAVQDVLAGSADCIYMTEAKPDIDAGQLVALATNGSHRDARFPDVPTLTELGLKNSEMTFWQGVFVPASTPDAIAGKLSEALKAAVSDLQANNVLQDAGFAPLFIPPAQASAKIGEDMKKYLSIANTSRIVIE
jgi:tripartite-type tricarboxylate transporter receptor subunit TctC